MQQAMQREPEERAKLRATAAILTTYLHNRIRLLHELKRRPRDTQVVNTIRAYLHILRSLEEKYDLSPLRSKTGTEG